MTTPNDLSDAALAIFAFAAYHQLASGDAVSSIVANDGTGHRADPKALRELVGRDLIVQEGERLHFTPGGQLLLSQIVDRIRGSW